MARTVGALLGKAQRYVADVKAEVSRSIELEELKKMKDTMESAAKDVRRPPCRPPLLILKNPGPRPPPSTAAHPQPMPCLPSGRRGFLNTNTLAKKWRVKQAAMPQWYKSRSGVRTKVQSGAAR